MWLEDAIFCFDKFTGQIGHLTLIRMSQLLSNHIMQDLVTAKFIVQWRQGNLLPDFRLLVLGALRVNSKERPKYPGSRKSEENGLMT